MSDVDPAGHVAHAVAPPVAANVDAAQSVQAEPDAGEKLPASHAAQRVKSALLVSPARQGVQLDCPVDAAE